MPGFATEELKRLIETQVRFDEIKRLWRADSPRLFVAAVDVLSGSFRVFRDREISVEAVLASAAVPPLFRAVEVNEAGATRFYWDGLLSQNPPIRDLPDAFGHESPLNPEEIWIIQINPDSRPNLPMGTGDIIDRRNELAGNLLLRQEIDVIRLINDLCAQGRFADRRYKPVTLRRIALARDDLDLPSKLDRSPEFIAGLMRQGEHAAERFLAEPEAHRIGDPAPVSAA
jgi:NTE family protein